MLTAALVAASAAYVAVVTAVALGERRLSRATAGARGLADHALPRAAVIVPARDEEGRLPRCLEALLAQDYPADRLLVVVADDHSTDATAAVVARYGRPVRLAVAAATSAVAGREPGPVAAGPVAGDGLPGSPAGPRVAGVRVPDGGPLRGKAAALHAGVEAAAAFDPDVLLFTDADCAPPPGWCRAMASRLSEPGVGLVCGRTEVAAPEGTPTTALAAAEALDWMYLLTAGAVLTEHFGPGTGMGNNMGLRRAAYDAVGGYPGVRFSVTEDHAMFNAVKSRTPWRVRFPLEPALSVRTLPLSSIAEIYSQRRRWARGGMRSGPLLFSLYTVTHLGNLAPVLALALAAAGLVPAALAVALFLSKLGVDLMFYRGMLPPGRRALLRGFLAAEGLQFLYFTTLPLALVLAPRIRWKGRTH